MGEGAWRAGARVMRSVTRGIVVVRRTIRLTRVDLRPSRSSSSMLAHAPIATRMMTRPALTRAPPPITLLFSAHYLIRGKITSFFPLIIIYFFVSLHLRVVLSFDMVACSRNFALKKNKVGTYCLVCDQLF